MGRQPSPKQRRLCLPHPESRPLSPWTLGQHHAGTALYCGSTAACLAVALKDNQCSQQDLMGAHTHGCTCIHGSGRKFLGCNPWCPLVHLGCMAFQPKRNTTLHPTTPPMPRQSLCRCHRRREQNARTAIGSCSSGPPSAQTGPQTTRAEPSEDRKAGSIGEEPRKGSMLNAVVLSDSGIRLHQHSDDGYGPIG